MSITYFLQANELAAMGFALVGDNVRIDRSARFYGANRISIGSNVRIDAYAVLSAGAGGIVIGDHVHIAVYSSLAGSGRIELCDFSGLSGRVSIYSSTDDYFGDGLTNPTVPDEFRRVTSAPVVVGKHAVIGVGSIIMPGVTISEGAAIGAMSLIKTNVPPFVIIAEQSHQITAPRKRNLLELEKQLRAKWRN